MKVLSLFDGISCGMLALQRAGIFIEEYHAFEIDKSAIKVSKTNFPNIIHHGDVLQADFNEFKDFDLLIGGSPCQSFSFAGKGLGFDDPRGQLFFKYLEALKTISPKYFLLENVVMKKEHEKVISELLGVEPILINSNLVSAQNRSRLYWTNIPNVTIPEDRKIFWKDVRDNNVNEMSYYYTEKGLKWLARHSRNKNKKLRVHQDNEKMQMIEASHSKGYSSQRFFGIIDYPTDESIIGAMRGRRINASGKREDTSEIPITQMLEFRYDGKSNCLTTVGKDNVVMPFTLENRVPVDDFFFRYLTPEECERLQTLPTGYTSCLPKTQRYKSIGNCWTVEVISHILSFIK